MLVTHLLHSHLPLVSCERRHWRHQRSPGAQALQDALQVPAAYEHSSRDEVVVVTLYLPGCSTLLSHECMPIMLCSEVPLSDAVMTGKH
jgi:hypothetical protein